MQILTSAIPLPLSDQNVNMSDPSHFREAYEDSLLGGFFQEDDAGYSYAAQTPLQESSEYDFSSDITLESAFDSYVDPDAISSSGPSEFTDVRDPFTPQSEFASQPQSPIDADMSTLSIDSTEALGLVSSLFSPSDQMEMPDYDQRWADPADDINAVNMLPSILPEGLSPLFSQSLPYSSSSFSPPTSSSSSYSPRAVRPRASRTSSPIQTSIGSTRRRSRVSKTSSAARVHRCDFDGCDKSYPRPCDLTKHKKRHEKPFQCRFSCDNTRFSTAKDRQRHEHSKHQKPDHLICCECGHTTARKDNITDHVKRKHPGLNTANAVATIMSNAISRRASV